MAESAAVDVLRQELKNGNGQTLGNLSIRVKWGQGDLLGLGPLRPFVEKHPEVFAFDGQSVKLAGSGPPGMGVGKAPGLMPPPAPPGLKRYAENHPDSPESKVGRGDGDSALDHFLNGPPGLGAPTSKAKWGGDPNVKAPPAAAGKGAGKAVKGGFDGKGKGVDFGCKGAGADGKGGSADGGKDFGKGDTGGKGGDLSPQDLKNAVQEDGLEIMQAKRGIEVFKTNGVEIELSMLTKKLSPGDEARRNAQRCLNLVRSVVSMKYGSPGPNTPSVELCGSYAQGTEVSGSDMDLAFRLPPTFSDWDKDNCVSELRDILSQKHTSNLTTFDTLAHYPHTNSPMAVELKGAEPGLVTHILVEEQRVSRPPTVDEAIKQMCGTFQASFDLVRLVKVWSVNHGLTNQQKGFINGAAWTLLTIFYLQKSKLVPPYSIIAEGRQIAPVTNPTSLSHLLQGFFEFLAQRSSSTARGISLWQGEEFEGPPALFLEDPAHFRETRQQRSLSETLGEDEWARILDEAKKAFGRIKVRPQRWFHWAEVFDPTDRPPKKIHGLAQHLAGDDSKGGAKGAADGKGGGKDSSEGKSCGKDDSKGWSQGKDADGKGWSGKDSGCKGGKDEGKGGSWMGKDSDGKGKDFGCKGGKEDGKGMSWSGDGGKGFGKAKDAKGKGGNTPAWK